MDNQRIEMPMEFLSKLGDALKAHEGVDIALANLVSQHLLTTAPNQDCVGQALAAITQLATDRASLPKEPAHE